MGIVAKYRFDPTIYADYMPEFNSDFYGYYVSSDVKNDDGTITRTIECYTTPTLMRFGQVYNAENDNATPKSLSLLEIYEMDLSTVTSIGDMFRKCQNLTAIHCQFNCNFDIITNMQSMFADCFSLTSLDVSNFNTENVTIMNWMFQNCSSLTSLDISNFNTKNVTSMNLMFQNCSSLTSLDISNFDTEKVTNMNNMFFNCSKLTSLDVSNFNTQNVTNTSGMFYKCSLLTSLDVSNFNTEKVTDMNGMFQNCSSLTSLDVSNFKTENVTNMSWMFNNCSLLTSLDVSNFNTEKVTDMGCMFYGCSSLTFLDLSNFNTEKVNGMSEMFNRCSSLTSLDVSNFNTENVNNMQYMFHDCSSLIYLDVLNFNTKNVKNMRQMFRNCSSLTSLNISNLNTQNIINMNAMFENCSSLTSLNISNFNTENVTDMSWMFNNCSSLTSLDITNFNTENVENMEAMFYSCSSLTSLNVSNFNTKNATNMNYIFRQCSSLTSLDISNFNTENTTTMRHMFQNCSSLTSLDISNFNTENVTNMNDMSSMFQNCSKLIDVGMIYCNSSVINKISSLITTNTKIYYYLPDISELEPHDNIEYIKYIFPTKIQLPPHIQLHKLPDGTCDELDIKTGILIRRIDENYNLLEEEITEKLILNYNNSCNYGVILPRGTSDNYNVITNEYKQNLDFIPIDGSIAFDTATTKDTTIKYSVALSKFEIDTTNVRGSDGIYCNNDLFKYEVSDNDYEHAYIEDDTTLHIYVNKSRLSSYDQVGFQLYLTNNPFDLYYAMKTPIISYVNYEDLNPEKASWEMLDCTEDGSITIESGEMDKTLLLDCMDYVAPSKNRFEIDLLKANTRYTVYTEGVSGKTQLNFGGNIVNFTSGNIYTSGETQLVEFYTDNEIKNLIIIEGDTRTETIDFFEGLKSSENVTVISTNAPFVFGKGGKIQ